MQSPQIVWLRRDLRLTDQAAFHAAAQEGPVIPVYVLDDEGSGAHAYGGASRWWLHHSLASLARELERKGSRLILRRGNTVEQLLAVAEDVGAAAIHALRHYEPWWRKAQGALAERIALRLHDGNYLVPPGSLKTGAGSPYKIFTPFSRELERCFLSGEPLPEPELAMQTEWPESDRLEDWKLLPTSPDWSAGLTEAWHPGLKGAQTRLADFLEQVSAYDSQRNFPSLDTTSRLSPHLHFGEISPMQVWRALDDKTGRGAASFRRELIWRDYAQNVVCQKPDYAVKSYREEYAGFPWRDPQADSDAAADLLAWQKGRTGYPVVDAGMRQLWATGWMHNRVRMIAASFLVKHLLIDWRVGEAWFRDTLVDADFANNSVNWQWVAGTGMDANMFTRMMAPLSQSLKFDAGEYIRKWVPELAGTSDTEIHDPSEHGGVAGYPVPLVSHREGRARALDAYYRMKEGREGLS